MSVLDPWLVQAARVLARRTSRRGFLARLGALLAGIAAVPLLPVERGRAQVERAPGEPDPETPEGNPQDCGYWRYCALDGFLASCCGGTHLSCPPGTEMSPITWIGTCQNPVDGKHYVVSYNDCCGKRGCGRCFCHRNEGDKPVYFPQKSNDINWCMGQIGATYNSTVALVVGISTEKG